MNLFLRLLVGLSLGLAACEDVEEIHQAEVGMDVGVDSEDSDIRDVVNMQPDTPKSVFLANSFFNIAHRGGGRLAPEHTMIAYANAMEVGADALECDAHATSDGVVVCIHDETVTRTTNGTGRVRNFDFDALRALDAGHQFATDGGETFPFRGLGHRIATLDELLQGFPDVPVTIEIKQTDPPIHHLISEAIDRHDAAERVVVVSFSDPAIQAFRELRPDVVTAMALTEMLLFARLNDVTEATYVPPCPIIQAPIAQVSPTLLARARRFGLRVHVWTVNDSEDMSGMLDIGVDGIFSDDPRLLAEIVNSRL